MMNYFKKIDHYLLLNHPVLWRTKVHYFVVLFLAGRILSPILANVMFNPGQKLYFISQYSFYFLLLIFIFWMVSQARMKLPIYRFSSQIKTFFTYMLCMCLLFLSFNGFNKTITKKTAELVDVSQLDLDRQYLENYRTQDENSFDNRYYRNAKVGEKESLQRDKIREMLKRYYWLDKDKVFNKSVNMRKSKKVSVEPILREIAHIEIANKWVENHLNHCESQAARDYGVPMMFTNDFMEQVGYIKCRLVGYYFLLFFSVLALLAAQMKFRAFLGLLFLYVGLCLSVLILDGMYFGFRSIETLITLPIMFYTQIFVIVFVISLMATLGIQKNNKLRRFLVFFCVFCTPFVVMNLVFYLASVINFSNTLEYLVKALFVLIPTITALSTYLIVKKNVHPQIK